MRFFVLMIPFEAISLVLYRSKKMTKILEKAYVYVIQDCHDNLGSSCAAFVTNDMRIDD